MDVFLNLYQNNNIFSDCDELWGNINDITITLENENSIVFYSKEILRTLKTYTSNTYYHFHKSVRSDKWYIKRFKEINGVFLTLNHQLNNNPMLQYFNPVLIEIKNLRRLLIIRHYDGLLHIESTSIPKDVNFTFDAIPHTFFDDGFDGEIQNWKNENLIGIYNKFQGYEKIGHLLKEMVKDIAHKIISCEEPNFQI
ncbi:hypothetical protein ACTFIY_009037 [Dictyostelium cf. discoideum]